VAERNEICKCSESQKEVCSSDEPCCMNCECDKDPWSISRHPQVTGFRATKKGYRKPYP